MKRPTWEYDVRGPPGAQEIRTATMSLPRGVTICVHRYIGHPKDQWLLTLYPKLIDLRLLENKQLEEAQQEALAITREHLRAILDALETP